MSDHSSEPWGYKLAQPGLKDDPEALCALLARVDTDDPIPIVSHWIGGDDSEEGTKIDEMIRSSQSRWADSAITQAHARRIVACVNACKGISTEALELTTTGLKSLMFGRDPE